MGLISSRESSRTPAALRRNRASSETSFPPSRRAPVAKGFITPASTPLRTSAAAIPPAMTVFPTPVSVPVTRKLRFINCSPG